MENHFQIQVLLITEALDPKMDNDDESLDENPSSPQVENPMAYLGLRRRNAGETDSDVTPVKKDPGIALNRRGIPARYQIFFHSLDSSWEINLG